MTDIDIGGAEDFAAFAEDLREAADRLDDAVDEGVQETAKQIELTAKQNAPVDTGTLRNSIGYNRIEPGVFEVGAGVDYAADVEFGTAPHVITPTDADALAFEGQDGELIFRQSVDHPGTPAQPFLRPALQEHQSDLAANIEAEIEALFTEVFG